MREFGPQLKELRAGYCHGDLTLENIIVGHKPDKYIKSSARVLHLIDFLDSFIDTPYVDIATVLQDSLCHWSYRYKELDEEQERYLKNFTHEFLINVNGSHRENMKLILGFLLFKIYRIVPYAKDDVTKRWCEDNIRYVKDLISRVSSSNKESSYFNIWDLWEKK
jgi:thiamine kinase-like enzyme